MRLFVAVDLSDEVRHHARAARHALCRRAPRLERELRWVDSGLMHVTLRFIGEVDDAGAERLRQTLDQPIARAPFDLEPADPHWLPSAARPRVLVLGFRRGGDQLRELHDAVEVRVRAAVPVGPEERMFLPHLTLARVRDPRRTREFAALGPALVDEPESRPSARVDHVTLYQSHLSPKGPTYVALARATLTGGA